MGLSRQKDLTGPAQREYILARIPLPTLPSLGKSTKGILTLCKSRGDSPAPSHVENSVIPAVVHIVYTEHLSCARCGPGALISYPYPEGTIRDSHTGWVLESIPWPAGPSVSTC